MWLLPVGLLLGISLGFLTNLHIPEDYSGYVMVAVLAAFDTLFGGIRALLNN
jgi:small basic protein